MNRRFADLTPLQALQAAIAMERRNTALYENLAQAFGSYDEKVSEVFADMAQEEIAHRLELEAYLRREFPGESPTDRDDPDIYEVIEAPDLDEPEAFIFDNVTVKRAIQMAEHAEADAYFFYQTISQQLCDEGLRALCEHMAKVEAEHRDALARWTTGGDLAFRSNLIMKRAGGIF